MCELENSFLHDLLVTLVRSDRRDYLKRIGGYEEYSIPATEGVDNGTGKPIPHSAFIAHSPFSS